MPSTDLPRPPQTELQQVARVQAGYLNRTRVEESPEGSHRLLQARDLPESGPINLRRVARFNPKRNPELYQVAHGDLLVVARGQGRGVYLIDQELPDTLASSVFYIIRPRPEFVDPRFLAWCLRQPEAQSALASGSRGTGISYLSRQAVEQLPVSLPPLHIQHQISAVVLLDEKAAGLRHQLNIKRRDLINAVCRQALQSTENHHA